MSNEKKVLEVYINGDEAGAAERIAFYSIVEALLEQQKLGTISRTAVDEVFTRAPEIAEQIVTKGAYYRAPPND